MNDRNFVQYISVGRAVDPELQAYADECREIPPGSDVCLAIGPHDYICSIRKDHPGLHVAAGGTEDGHTVICATWDRAETGVLAW